MLVCQRQVLSPSGYFSVIGLKMVAGRHRHTAYLIITSTGAVLFSGINIDDLEP